MQQLSNGIEKVAWLGEAAPSSALSSYLQRRGIALVTPKAGELRPAARMTTLEGIARFGNIAGGSIDSTVAVVHPDSASADAIGAVLRKNGARVTTLRPDESLDRLNGLIPDTILVDATDLHRSCWDLVRAIWDHPWLRFIPVLVGPPGSLQAPKGAAWDLAGLDAGLRYLRRDCRQLTASVRKDLRVSLELDSLGAARILRALMDSGLSLRIRIETPADTFNVDVVGPLVFGAYGGPRRAGDDSSERDARWVGPAAMGALLACNEGVVSVRELQRLTVANIMSPLSAALSSAIAPPEAAVEEEGPESKEPTVATRRRSRNDNTLAGMGAAERLAANAPVEIVAPRAAAIARPREDRTLMGIGRAKDQPPALALASVQNTNYQIMPEVFAVVTPAARPAQTAEAAQRAARRAADKTLVGIGGAGVLAGRGEVALKPVAVAESTTPPQVAAALSPALAAPQVAAATQPKIADGAAASTLPSILGLGTQQVAPREPQEGSGFLSPLADAPGTTSLLSATTRSVFDGEDEPVLHAKPRPAYLMVALVAVMVLVALVWHAHVVQP